MTQESLPGPAEETGHDSRQLLVSWVGSCQNPFLLSLQAASVGQTRRALLRARDAALDKASRTREDVADEPLLCMAERTASGRPAALVARLSITLGQRRGPTEDLFKRPHGARTRRAPDCCLPDTNAAIPVVG